MITPTAGSVVLLEMLDDVEIALDVGQWVLHCHIQEHGEAAMMTVMEVAADA